VACDPRSSFHSMTYFFLFALAAKLLAAAVASTEDFASGLVLLQVQGNIVVGKDGPSSEASLEQSIVPRMIMQRGCTCSSTVMQYARALLQEMHVPLFNLQVKELLRTVHIEQNPWHHEGDDVVTAFQRGLNETSSQGLGLLFNNFKITEGGEKKNLNQLLISSGTRTVIVHRANVLDTLVCEVRDCFKGLNEPPRGYPVDLEGTPNDLCFLRRGADGGGVKTKAVIDTEHMTWHLNEAEEYAQQQQAVLGRLGFQSASIVTVEDLLAHEYSEKDVHRSYTAWITLLESLGVKPKHRTVMNYLRERVGSYSPPEEHWKAIWNVGPVVKVLKENNRMDLWRGTTGFA